MKTKNPHLAKFAKLFVQINTLEESMSKGDRRKAIRSAKTRTRTNCWWAEYRAAQHVLTRWT